MNKKVRHQKAISLGVVGFIITIFISKWLLTNLNLNEFLKIIVVLLPILPLTYWWWQYPQLLKDLDELEQAIELEALAKGTVIGLWLITLWALLEGKFGISSFPAFLAPPIIVTCYAIARLFVVRKYK